MPFKGVDVMDVKKEFVLKSLDERIVFTEVCRKYGISTKCGYQWRKWFLEEGYSGLEERSRKPLSNARSIPEPVSVEILRIKKLHPAWGARKTPMTYGRWISKGGWYTKNRERVNPLTVRDEYSRFILAIAVAEKGDTASVKAVFQRLFKKYGLPRYIRSDNGSPFANMRNYWGLPKLSVWCMTPGIQLDRRQIDGSLHEHQKVFDQWRKEFNEVRPHEALGMKVPKEVYKKSELKYGGEYEEVRYGRGCKVRKEYVDKASEVWFGRYLLGTINGNTGLIEPSCSILRTKEKPQSVNDVSVHNCYRCLWVVPMLGKI